MNRHTILYVEDEVYSRMVMEMIVSDVGSIDATILDDSAQVLECALALDPKPDAIFLDIHMKPFSGFEVLKMLRDTSVFDHTPIIAMTASVMNEEVHQLRQAGFNGCLAKPLDMDRFPDQLRRIIQGESIWRIVS